MEILVEKKNHIIFRDISEFLVAIHRTDQKDIMNILNYAKLNLPTFECVMEKSQKHPEILDKIVGTFHVMPEDVSNMQGLYRFENGLFAEGAGTRDNTIYIKGGNSGTLIIEVHGNRTADLLKRRFTLYPKDGSDPITDRIVGIRQEKEAMPSTLFPIRL